MNIDTIIVKFIIAYSKVKVNINNTRQIDNKKHNAFRRAKAHTKYILQTSMDLCIPFPYPKACTEEKLFLHTYDLKTFGNHNDQNIRNLYRHSTLFRTSFITDDCKNNNNIDS